MTHKGSGILGSSIGLILTFVGAFVPMIIFRVGSGSGFMFSITVMLAVYAVIGFRRRRYGVLTLVWLLALAAATLAWLCVAASHAAIEPGTSIREVDATTRWVFFANVCLFSGAFFFFNGRNRSRHLSRWSQGAE